MESLLIILASLDDCMADRKGDLMFLAGDEITVLRALSEEVFLVSYGAQRVRRLQLTIAIRDTARVSLVASTVLKSASRRYSR